MNKSKKIDKLSTALSKAQAEMPSAKKSSVGFFKNKYADLSAIMEAINAPLTNNGLSFSQLVTSSPDGRLIGLETMLTHESGQWMSTAIYCPNPAPDWHQMGSAITYLRRYSLQAIAGVPAEDDDANNAMGLTKPAPAPKKKPQKVTPEAAEKLKARLVDAGISLAKVTQQYGELDQITADVFGEITRKAIEKEKENANKSA